MSERRPRLNKKLNSNDRKAMVRIMTVLLRNCIAVLQASNFNCTRGEQEEGQIRKRYKSLFSKGLSRKRNCTQRKFAL